VKVARTQRHLLAQQAAADYKPPLPVTLVLTRGKKLGDRYCMVNISVCGETFMVVGPCASLATVRVDESPPGQSGVARQLVLCCCPMDKRRFP
jgi:hypothetical protein